MANNGKYGSMRLAILRALVKLPGRLGGRALTEALCLDKALGYHGRNPYRLHSTVNGALLRLTEMDLVERIEDTVAGRKRYTYAITPAGRKAIGSGD